MLHIATPLPKLGKHKGLNVLALGDSGLLVGRFYNGHYMKTYEGGTLFTPPTTVVYVPITDAFVFDGRHIRDLGVGQALAVNASGVVVGTTDGGTGDSGKAFIYQHGHRRLIAPKGHVSTAYSVNAAGDVLVIDWEFQKWYEYSHITHRLIDLGIHGYPRALNNAGQAIGEVGVRGTLYSGGKIIDLGTFGGPYSRADGLNDSGVVVGSASTSTASSPNTPFIYSNGRLTDLNTLAPATDTGWTIDSASGINDAGQILARGTNAPGGPEHVLLLTPN